MGRGRAVGGHDGPLILEHLNIGSPHRHHRLDGESHSCLETGATARTPVIRYWRVHMHLRSDAVPDVLLHDSVPAGPSNALLDAMPNVGQVATHPCLRQPGPQ